MLDQFAPEYLKCNTCGKRKKGIPVISTVPLNEEDYSDAVKGFECGQCKSQICISCAVDLVESGGVTVDDTIICPECSEPLGTGIVFINPRLEESKLEDIKKEQVRFLSGKVPLEHAYKTLLYSGLYFVIFLLGSELREESFYYLVVSLFGFGLIAGLSSFISSSPVVILLRALYGASLAISLLFFIFIGSFKFFSSLYSLGLSILLLWRSWEGLKTYNQIIIQIGFARELIAQRTKKQRRKTASGQRRREN